MKKFNFLENLLRREFAMSGMRGMNGLRAEAVNPDSQPTVNKKKLNTCHNIYTQHTDYASWLKHSPQEKRTNN